MRRGTAPLVIWIGARGARFSSRGRSLCTERSGRISPHSGGASGEVVAEFENRSRGEREEEGLQVVVIVLVPSISIAS